MRERARFLFRFARFCESRFERSEIEYAAMFFVNVSFFLSKFLKRQFLFV